MKKQQNDTAAVLPLFNPRVVLAFALSSVGLSSVDGTPYTSAQTRSLTTTATLAATVEEQASQIQKVSAQLEVSKRAPQTVANRSRHGRFGAASSRLICFPNQSLVLFEAPFFFSEPCSRFSGEQ